MISHHAIAILTSERAQTRVGQLADEIVGAQRRETAGPEALIADLEPQQPPPP